MQALYQLILTLRIQVPKIEARFYAVIPRWIGYVTVTDFAGFLGPRDRRQALSPHKSDLDNQPPRHSGRFSSHR